MCLKTCMITVSRGDQVGDACSMYAVPPKMQALNGQASCNRLCWTCFGPVEVGNAQGTGEVEDLRWGHVSAVGVTNR